MLYIMVGTLILSASASYAWWTRVRIIDLRQDIFDERDELFDVAMRLDALDDPAYRAARRHLNHIARTVDFISLELLVYVGQHLPPLDPIHTENEPLRNAIDDACVSCARRIVHSLLRETVSGRILLLRFRLRGIVTALEKQVTDRMMIWLSSGYPESVDRVNTLAEQPA